MRTVQGILANSSAGSGGNVVGRVPVGQMKATARSGPPFDQRPPRRDLHCLPTISSPSGPVLDLGGTLADYHQFRNAPTHGRATPKHVWPSCCARNESAPP